MRPVGRSLPTPGMAHLNVLYSLWADFCCLVVNVYQCFITFGKMVFTLF